MDQSTLDLLLFFFVCTSTLLVTMLAKSMKSTPTNLPPGPPTIPISGNLLDMGKKPHKSLANLSKIHGPLMILKLGTTTNIVISSPKYAKEILQKNDQLFSNRAILDVATHHDHHKFSMVWLPPTSPLWKTLRKIGTTQLFSVQQMNASQFMRQDKVQQLLDHVQECCESGQSVDIGRAAFTTSLNLLSSTFFSMDMAHHHLNLSHDFKDLVRSVMELGEKANVSDFFPILRIFDLQGIRRKVGLKMNKLFDIFDGIIEQRLNLRDDSKKDVLDALIALAQDETQEFKFSHIKHLLFDLIVAGTDTTSSTLEWAMAELMKNPSSMLEAKRELEQVIGKDNKIHESNIPKLPYLQSIVKETLRLHPPAPLLLPRKLETNIEVDGFSIPKNARVLVNAWAIGRDPTVWENPHLFEPQRFLKSEVKNAEFELIPFGGGRRICPGMPLALRMVHLMLASLLHSFDWKLLDGSNPRDLDMDDRFGATSQKALPLVVMPIKVRQNIHY